MNVLDLFSGIGGFSLGLERAGMRTVAFCEIDPFCRRVLTKHWPTVPIYDDVRTITAARLSDSESIRCQRGLNGSGAQGNERNPPIEGTGVDVICGGFPCQDISVAGKGAGIEGERSGLWSEYARIIGEVRPRYVIVENVAALLGRGLSRVLGDLAALGFDAEWHCIPASAVGAPHRRDRVWIMAYSPQGRQRANWWPPWQAGHIDLSSTVVADTTWHVRSEQETCGTERERVGQSGQSIPAHADSARRSDAERRSGPSQSDWRQIISADDVGRRFYEWEPEPDVGRVAHGVPARVDRLRSLGNAVVPQIPEIIGRAIMKAELAA